MRDWSYLPALAVTAFFFAVAFCSNFFSLDTEGHVVAYALASLALAAPFALIFRAQVRAAHTWRRNLFLLVGNLLLAFLFLMASFLLRWFQPGIAGVVVFSVILSVLALAYGALARCIRE